MNIRTLLGALVLSTSATTMAATEDRGFYFGTGLGQSDANDAPEFGLVDDTSTAFRIFGGYEFSRLLSAEVGYLDFGNYTGSIPAIGGPADTRFKLDGFSIGLRPQIALGSDWFVQAQVGAFLWDSNAVVKSSLGRFEDNDNGENAYYGLGLGRNFGPAFRVSGEWTRFETDTADVDFWNLAMTYRLGK